MSHTRQLTVRATVLAGFSGLCRNHGVDPLLLLRSAGLPADIEAQPDQRVPANQIILLLNLAASACKCDDFGLQIAQLRGFSNLGPVGLLARDEPTVGAALTVIETYLPVHNDALVLTRDYFDDMVLLGTTILGAGSKTQSNDIAVAMQFRVLQQLSGTDWRPEEICLSRTPPDDDRRFRRVFFGSRIQFNAAFDGIVIRADALDRPNQLADPVFHRVASETWRLGLPGASETLAARVRRALPGLIATRHCTASHVANRLGISRRTLTRLLAAEATGFQSLHDETRDDLARHHLAIRSRKVSDIADALGFSSPAAFSSWFRRRHGVAPRAWRQAKLEHDIAGN